MYLNVVPFVQMTLIEMSCTFESYSPPQNEPQPHIMHIHLTNILLKRQGENVIQQSSNLLVSFLSIISSSFQSID